MRIVRKIASVAALAVALGGSLAAVDVSSVSAARESRAKFFERYESLGDYAQGRSGDKRTWIPSTRVSKKAWAAAIADESIRVDATGRAFVVDELHSEPTSSTPVSQSISPVADIPLSDAFLLNSLPGSNRTIYLDFTGHSIAGTIWQDQNTATTADDYTNEQMAMPAYTDDADVSTFNNTELQNIIDAWSAIAEDYAPFDVNVTTQDPGQAAITRSSEADLVFGVRAVITNSTNVIAASCGCGGIAYVDVFDYPVWNTYLGPALNFTQAGFNGKTISDIVSHEVGHNLGLSHDGFNSDGYYGGRDGWAPIMGVGYYEPLVQFSNGTYTSANQAEDDFSVMGSNGITLRTDDHGDTRANATAIEPGASDDGVITSRTDVDYFSFTANGASHDVTVTLPSGSPNLDVQARLYDSSGNIVSTTNPDLFRVNGDVATGLDATFTASTTSGATYYVAIDGVGFGSGTTTGYSDYGSLGEYSVAISGTPLLALSQGTPLISGSGVFGNTLTGATGTWTDGTAFTTEWYRNGSATGDTDDTYTILASDVGKTITYRVSGSKTGYATSSVTSSGVTVTAATLPSTGTPAISGTAAVGQTLTGDSGTWPSGVTLSTQWYRNGSSIGDTDSSYTLQAGDIGKTIVFRVVATKTGYTSVTANSSSVTVVAGTISPTATPTISGTAKVKKVLTANVTGWMSGVTFSYQWLRNGSPIANAISSTYKLKATDKGKRISVRVTATKTAYDPVILTSLATAKVKA